MAVRKDGGWVINGSKTFTTNGHYADVCVGMAATDKSKKSHGISAFIVEKGTNRDSAGKEREQARFARERYFRSDLQRLLCAWRESSG